MKRIPDPLAPQKSAKSGRKIEELTVGLDGMKKLSIGVLSDRHIMLGDLAGTVSLMNRDLSELMRALRTR